MKLFLRQPFEKMIMPLPSGKWVSEIARYMYQQHGLLMISVEIEGMHLPMLAPMASDQEYTTVRSRKI